MDHLSDQRRTRPLFLSGKDGSNGATGGAGRESLGADGQPPIGPISAEKRDHAARNGLPNGRRFRPVRLARRRVRATVRLPPRLQQVTRPAGDALRAAVVETRAAQIRRRFPMRHPRRRHWAVGARRRRRHLCDRRRRCHCALLGRRRGVHGGRRWGAAVGADAAPRPQDGVVLLAGRPVPIAGSDLEPACGFDD